MTPLEWYLIAYGVVVTILFLIVDGANAGLREQIDDLKRRLHPSTRNDRKADR